MYFIYINTLYYYLCGSLKERVYRQRHSRRKPVSQSQGPNRIFLRKAAGCQKTYRILLLRVSQEQRMRIFYDEKEIRQTLSVLDRKSTRLNSSHVSESRMPSSA